MLLSASLEYYVNMRMIYTIPILIVAAIGCDDDTKKQTDAGITDAGITDHGTYATFNAGLAYGYVPYADDRQPFIGPAVAGMDADVICIQEIWHLEDLDDLLSATSASFPHSYWVDTYDPEANTGPAACLEDDTAELYACVIENCDVDPDSLSDCVLDLCSEEFGVLAAANPDCLNCLVANLGNPVDQIFDTCHEESKEYLYEAANGVIILSRLELKDTNHLILDSTFNKRLVLFARTESPAGESLALACTHLTPEFDGVPYTGEFGSWSEEQAFQIGLVIDFIAANAANDEIVVFMGDTNNGPELPGIDPELPDNYAAIIDAGFLDPYAQSESPQCTQCEENPLNSGTVSEYIDHVFFKNLPEAVNWESFRLLDDVIDLETAEGMIESRLSDHYATAVTLTE